MIDFPATSILHNFGLLKANIHKIVGLKYCFQYFNGIHVFTSTYIQPFEKSKVFSEIVYHRFHQLTSSHKLRRSFSLLVIYIDT